MTSSVTLILLTLLTATTTITAFASNSTYLTVTPRTWCEVEHGKNFYSDSTVRVSKYGLYSEAIDNCRGEKSSSQKVSEQAKAAQEVKAAAAENKFNELASNKNAIRLDVQFEVGSATIENKYSADLAQLTEALQKDATLSVVVSGHTDAIGSEAYNLTLSKARAEAIKKALTDKGIEASRITAQGLGATAPKADNKSAMGRAQNRRIEVTVK